MFKIKGEKKNYFLKIGSEVQIYDTMERLWRVYVIQTMKFDKLENKVEVHYFGVPKFVIGEEIYLCRESHINEHIEQNILRIVKR